MKDEFKIGQVLYCCNKYRPVTAQSAQPFTITAIGRKYVTLDNSAKVDKTTLCSEHARCFTSIEEVAEYQYAEACLTWFLQNTSRIDRPSATNMRQVAELLGMDMKDFPKKEDMTK
jgi:hypothetical protein